MSRESRHTPTRRHGWWLESGTEQCGFCFVWFRYEAQYRCEDCDAPICPICVQSLLVQRTTHCPACAPAGPER